MPFSSWWLICWHFIRHIYFSDYFSIFFSIYAMMLYIHIFQVTHMCFGKNMIIIVLLDIQSVMHTLDSCFTLWSSLTLNTLDTLQAQWTHHIQHTYIQLVAGRYYMVNRSRRSLVAKRYCMIQPKEEFPMAQCWLNTCENSKQHKTI